MTGCKVDLFEKNTNTEEVRKVLKVNLNSPLVNNLKLPYIILHLELKSIHSVTKHLFSGLTVPNLRLAGQLKYLLSIEEGWKMPFDTIPIQGKTQKKIVCGN